MLESPKLANSSYGIFSYPLEFIREIRYLSELWPNYLNLLTHHSQLIVGFGLEPFRFYYIQLQIQFQQKLDSHLLYRNRSPLLYLLVKLNLTIFQRVQMPEATVIVLDNSQFAINGDYQPTRWLSQIDAACLLITTKLEQSHESAVGISLSGGKQVEVICTPSSDLTKVSSYLYGIKLSGVQKLSNALQTSALALKHRANPNLSQRIICFIASTISQSIEELKIIAKKLKKNNISLDLIAIGDLSEQQREKIQIIHDNVRSEVNNCELLFVDPTANLSDILLTSKIMGFGIQPAANATMINEAEDPELMMALQLSLQEEEQRLAARQPAQQMVNENDQLEQTALQLATQEQRKQSHKNPDKTEE